MTSKDIEHMEEAKLKAKFPMAANRPAHSAFLQKRLLKGVSGLKYSLIGLVIQSASITLSCFSCSKSTLTQETIKWRSSQHSLATSPSQDHRHSSLSRLVKRFRPLKQFRLGRPPSSNLPTSSPIHRFSLLL